MTIEKAMNRFQSAAEAAGYEVVTGSPGRFLAPPDQPMAAFDEEAARASLQARGVRANEEYLAFLSRWDGVGLRHPGQTDDGLFDFEAPAFSSCISIFDEFQKIFADPQFKYMREKFFVFFDDFRNQYGWDRALPTSKIFLASLEDYPPQVAFHSIENFLDTITAAVIDGVDMNERHVLTETEAMRAHDQFAAICFRETGLSLWL